MCIRDRIYRLAPIVFMGGSLVEHGGQNPIEAIRLGAAVVHGPHVWNFAEIYATLDAANGAKLVADEEALTVQLNAWLANPAARTAIAEAGAKTVRQLGGALDRTLAALDPYLVPVSYTHLPAERQIDGGTVPIVEHNAPVRGDGDGMDRPAGDLRELDDAEAGDPRHFRYVGRQHDRIAVSYTHLDVYKRQV